MRQQHGLVQRALSEGNRWWRDPEGWPTHDLDLHEARRAPYVHESSAVSGLTPGGLYVLRGPRRVGKSVAVKQAIQSLIADGTDPRRIVHMSVDGWSEADLGRLVQAARSLLPDGDRRFWFIDEITTVADGWPNRIKWLRDNDRWFRNDTVVLTGSSSSDLSESVGVLAGRRGSALDTDRILLPLGFRTFVSLTGRNAPPEPATAGVQVDDLTHESLTEATYTLAPWLHALTDAWEAYLMVGGFHQMVTPYTEHRTTENRMFSRELFEVVDRDALRRASWSRTETAAFLSRLTKGLGSHTNQSSVASDLGVTPPTVKSRIDDLCTAFVLWPCHREKRLRPQTRSQRKLYFTDTAYAHLARDPVPDLSVLSEQQLGMALLRHVEARRSGSYLDFDRVLHHRSATKAEIDFVGPDLGDVAIESKYVDGRWRRAAPTLKASRWRGVVATRTVLDLDNPDLMAIPTALLAWVLDT